MSQSAEDTKRISASIEEMFRKFKPGQPKGGTQPQERTPRKGKKNMWEFMTRGLGQKDASDNRH